MHCVIFFFIKGLVYLLDILVYIILNVRYAYISCNGQQVFIFFIFYFSVILKSRSAYYFSSFLLTRYNLKIHSVFIIVIIVIIIIHIIAIVVAFLLFDYGGHIGTSSIGVTRRLPIVIVVECSSWGLCGSCGWYFRIAIVNGISTWGKRCSCGAGRSCRRGNGCCSGFIGVGVSYRVTRK